MKAILSFHWALIASVWYFGNGILHSAAVLIQHKGPYDRELVRLLTTGHILLLSGAVVFIGWLMMIHKIQYGGVISIIVGYFMIIYCLMIFPFLKSFGTMAISAILILAAIKTIYSYPDITNIMKNFR